MELIWIDLLNSIWRDWRGSGRPTEDRLYQMEWQARFLKKWGHSAQLPAEDSDLHMLRELRGFLQQITEKLNVDGHFSQKDADYLNKFLKENPVVRHLELDEKGLRMNLISTQTGWKSVIESIVMSFIQTMMDGHAGRIKICDNKDCLWVYFDSTKNHSKKYCDDKACGNLLKVRKFRERQRNKQ